MVHFTQYCSASLFYSAVAVYESLHTGYPIRSSAGHRICAPNRSFSQLITTFFASRLLGIRHKPIFAWPYYLSCFSSLSSSRQASHAKSCVFWIQTLRNILLRNFLIRISTDAGSLLYLHRIHDESLHHSYFVFFLPYSCFRSSFEKSFWEISILWR